MIFHTVDLAGNGATLVQDGDAYTVTTVSNMSVPLGKIPDLYQAKNKDDLTSPAWAVEQALGSLVELDQITVNTNRNPSLSGFGKAQALAVPRTTAIARISIAADYLERHATKVATQEMERYAVPSIEKHDFASALADMEIREWARSLDGQARSDLFKSLGDGTAERVLLALGRSPISIQVLDKAATECWRISVDRRDPEGRAKLDLENQLINWARHVFGHTVGNLNRFHGLSREELHGAIKHDAGFKLFGFSAHEKLGFDRKALSKQKTKAA